MIVIMNAASSDQYKFSEGYDLAVVKIGEPEAKLLTRYFNLFDHAKKTEESFIEMTLNSTELSCLFYDFSIWGEDDELDDILTPEEIKTRDEIKASLEKKGYAVILDDKLHYFFEDDYEESNIPSELFLQVSEEGFWWIAVPEDADVTITTESLPRSLITSLLEPIPAISMGALSPIDNCSICENPSTEE